MEGKTKKKQGQQEALEMRARDWAGEAALNKLGHIRQTNDECRMMSCLSLLNFVFQYSFFLDYYRFSVTFAGNDFFQLSTIVCIPALFENLDLRLGTHLHLRGKAYVLHLFSALYNQMIDCGFVLNMLR